MSFNTAEPTIATAIAGRAASCSRATCWWPKALATGQLEIMLPEWSAEGAPISIVYPAALRNATKVRVFADFASELLLQDAQRVDDMLASY